MNPLFNEVFMNEQTSQPRPVIGGTRKHMGVATSDPTYLPPVDNPDAATDRKARVPVRKVWYSRSGGSAQNGPPLGPITPSRIPVASPTLQVRTHEGGGNTSRDATTSQRPKKDAPSSPPARTVGAGE